ncbi:hypothetical protein TIFTF001_005670 [Ficus carica]|uniref:Uncharacterized protein n=1 Tax=Ficus carica TaxID=3494 RepID=A0AA87ZK89_FICCA|nr:hypothetical protein TIFTF001_005670 [Ficus carica]
MPKTSGTTPNEIAWTRMYELDYSTTVHLQKEKHLKVIGTPASHQTLGGGWLSRAAASFPGTNYPGYMANLNEFSGKFYPGQHRTNSMVVVQHSSRGSSIQVNKHSSQGSSTRINIGLTRWWSFSIVPEEVLPGSTSIVPKEVIPGSTSLVPEEVLSSSRESSTQINIGPTQWWSFSIVTGEVLPRSTSIVPEEVLLESNIGPTRWWSFGIVPGKVLLGSTSIVPGEVLPGSTSDQLDGGRLA